MIARSKQLEYELKQFIHISSVADWSLSNYPALASHLRGAVGSGQSDRELVATIFAAALLPPKQESYPGLHGVVKICWPLRAAKHLMALGQYPEDIHEPIEDIGRSLSSLAMEGSKPFTTNLFPPKSRTLRHSMAVVAGGYGNSRGSIEKREPQIAASLLAAINQVLERESREQLIGQALSLMRSAEDLAEKREDRFSGRLAHQSDKVRQDLRPAEEEGVRDEISAPVVSHWHGAETSRETPHDLGVPPPYLAGRKSELNRLVHSGRRVLLITGTAGAGKTALALAAAQAISEKYADGCLQIDFQGYSVNPAISLIQGIRELLTRLGLSSVDLPDGEDQAVSMIRTVLARRRILVLADNVSNSHIAMALATGGRSSLIVTSRSELPALQNEIDVEHVHLDPLSASDSVSILERRAPQLVQAHPAVAREIARVCAYLPFTLTVVAARLARNPGKPLPSILEELNASAEGVLAHALPESDLTVRSILDWSFAGLKDSQLKLIVAMGHLPLGLDVDIVSALGGSRRDLDTLHDENLLTIFGPLDFINIHDLVREYVRTPQIADQVPPDELAQECIDVLMDLRDKVNCTAQEIGASRGDRCGPGKPLLDEGCAYSVSEQWHHRARSLLRMSQLSASFLPPAVTLAGLEAAFDLTLAIGAYELAVDILRPAIKCANGLSSPHDPLWINDVRDEWREKARRAEQLMTVFAVRSGWRSRMEPLLAGLSELNDDDRHDYNAATLRAWREIYILGGNLDIIQRARDAGEMVPIPPADEQHLDPIPKLDLLDLSILECQIQRNLEHDPVVSFNMLLAFYEKSKHRASRATAVDNFWSVEPPLMLLAGLFESQKRYSESIEVLRWVRRFYRSRATWYGHVLQIEAWMDRIERNL